MSEMLYAVAMGLCLRSLGLSMPYTSILIVTLFVRFVSGVSPIPGGLGIAEAGLTAGLVSIGVPVEFAFLGGDDLSAVHVLRAARVRLGRSRRAAQEGVPVTAVVDDTDVEFDVPTEVEAADGRGIATRFLAVRGQPVPPAELRRPRRGVAVLVEVAGALDAPAKCSRTSGDQRRVHRRRIRDRHPVRLLDPRAAPSVRQGAGPPMPNGRCGSLLPSLQPSAIVVGLAQWPGWQNDQRALVGLDDESATRLTTVVPSSPSS